MKKPKMKEDDKVVQIKPMRKAPRSTMLEKEDDADGEDPSEDKSISSFIGTGSSSSLSSPSGTGSYSIGTDSPLLRADEVAVQAK